MIRNGLVFYPILDVLFAIAWGWIITRHWSRAPDNVKEKTDESVDERALGATVILGQLGAVITGTSIILAAIGAFVALKGVGIGPTETYHLLFATGWAVVSLALAMYATGTLPGRTLRQNFVRAPEVALLSGMALYFSLAAGARFLAAVWAILLSSSPSPSP